MSTAEKRKAWICENCRHDSTTFGGYSESEILLQISEHIKQADALYPLYNEELRKISHLNRAETSEEYRAQSETILENFRAGHQCFGHMHIHAIDRGDEFDDEGDVYYTFTVFWHWF